MSAARLALLFDFTMRILPQTNGLNMLDFDVKSTNAAIITPAPLEYHCLINDIQLAALQFDVN